MIAFAGLGDAGPVDAPDVALSGSCSTGVTGTGQCFFSCGTWNRVRVAATGVVLAQANCGGASTSCVSALSCSSESNLLTATSGTGVCSGIGLGTVSCSAA